jgi:MerR family mercuric resistance operon transcriptional regulator
MPSGDDSLLRADRPVAAPGALGRGYRVYGPADIERLRFIARGRV